MDGHLKKVEGLLFQALKELEEIKIQKNDEEVSDSFARLLEGCDRKKIFEGVFPLLSELDRKKGNLWVFNGKEVVFNHKGSVHRETFEERGEFFKCYRLVVKKCRKECVSKINTTRDDEVIKNLMYKPQEYYSLEYETFWNCLKSCGEISNTS